MNKEQILNVLKELRDQLPTDIINSDYVTIEDITKRIIKEEEKLSKLGKLNVKNERLERLKETIKKLEFDLEEAQFEYDDIQRMLIVNENESISINSSIALSELRRQRELRRKEYYNNEDVITEIDKRIANIEEEIAQEHKEAKLIKEDSKVLNSKKNSVKQKNEAIQKKLNELRTKAIEIEAEEEKKKIDEATRNATALKSKLGFVSTGLFKELSDLITDYENGNVDNAVVNYTVDRIKTIVEANETLNSFEVEEAVVVDEQLEILDKQINKLERKVRSERNYVLSENQYNETLKKKREDLRRLKKNYNAQNRRFNENERRLNDPTLELTERNKTRIEKRNAEIASRMRERQKEISEMQLEIKRYEENPHQVDKVTRSKDRNELKALKENKSNLKYLRDIHEVSMLDKLNVLLAATGGTLTANSVENNIENNPQLEENDSDLEEELPVINDKDKDIVKPKFLLDDESDNLAPVIEPNDEEKGLVPLEPSKVVGEEETKEDFPLLDPVEVVGYEEPKEAVKKPNKLKKILLIAATALSLIAVGISSMIKKGKDNVVVPPTSTPSITDEMVEEEKPTITPELPTETPAPEDEKDNNDKPSKDKDDNKPSKDDDKPSKPTEKPDEEVEQTPEPIVAKPGDQIVDVIKDDDGNIIGERVTTIGDDGQVIVDETGDVEKLEDQEIIVDTDDVEIVDEKEELQQDNPEIAEDEALLDQFQEDLENGNIEDSIIWGDTLIDGTTGKEVSEDVPSSPDEVNIDNYSVKAEDTLDLNSPFGMSQEELDALINGILNGEDQSMTL